MAENTPSIIFVGSGDGNRGSLQGARDRIDRSNAGARGTGSIRTGFTGKEVPRPVIKELAPRDPDRYTRGRPSPNPKSGKK